MTSVPSLMLLYTAGVSPLSLPALVAAGTSLLVPEAVRIPPRMILWLVSSLLAPLMWF